VGGGGEIGNLVLRLAKMGSQTHTHTHNGPDGDVAGVGGMRAKRIMQEGRNRVKLMLKCTEEATDENYQSVG